MYFTAYFSYTNRINFVCIFTWQRVCFFFLQSTYCFFHPIVHIIQGGSKHDPSNCYIINASTWRNSVCSYNDEFYVSIQKCGFTAPGYSLLLSLIFFRLLLATQNFNLYPVVCWLDSLLPSITWVSVIFLISKFTLFLLLLHKIVLAVDLSTLYTFRLIY